MKDPSKDHALAASMRRAGLCNLVLHTAACSRQGLVPYVHISSPLSSLQDLGITKVGHMKRILQAIKELSNPP